MNTIITTGRVFADIDAVGCAYAYRELLNLLNINSEIVFEGPLNNTVTKSVRNLDLNILSKCKIENDDNFVIVDSSNHEVTPSFVDEKRIIEIYDHRDGYQNYWQGKDIRVKIDLVGACATLIWEEFKNRSKQENISPLSAKLLATAMFANTLNFKASLTTERDLLAFDEIKNKSKVDEKWIENYYFEAEKSSFDDPQKAIRDDTKVVKFEDKGINITIGQIELWNSKNFVMKNKDSVKKVLLGFNLPQWFLTAPSISDGYNYIYTESESVKKLLEKIIGAEFSGDIGVTKKLWLRKEILKKMLQ